MKEKHFKKLVLFPVSFISYIQWHPSNVWSSHVLGSCTKSVSYAAVNWCLLESMSQWVNASLTKGDRHQSPRASAERDSDSGQHSKRLLLQPAPSQGFLARFFPQYFKRYSNSVIAIASCCNFTSEKKKILQIWSRVMFVCQKQTSSCLDSPAASYEE